MLLLLDFDHFKPINDSAGHAAGDRVLVSAVPALQAAAGSNSLVARFGGEEFAVLFLADDASSIQIAEAIRRAAGAAGSEALGRTVTAFAGMCRQVHSELKTQDPQSAIVHALSVADQALYRAKNAGRDCLKWE